jgi:hypothetical protein
VDYVNKHIEEHEYDMIYFTWLSSLKMLAKTSNDFFKVAVCRGAMT